MSPTNSQFALMFVIATVGMLLLAIGIVLFVVFYQKKMLQEQLRRQEMEAEFQQRMLQATLDSQENERRRLAADLHDSIGAMLSTIKVGLVTLVRKEKIPEEEVLPTKQMLDDTIESVRAISRNLMPSTLEKFGLSQAIREMCERITETAKLPTLFNECGESIPLEKGKEIMLFRIVQELINNAIKHSGATEITVDVNWNDYLYIAVADNGKGFDYERQRDSKGNAKGLGLYNIENRSRLMGAGIKFENGKSGGSKISLRLALKNEKEN